MNQLLVPTVLDSHLARAELLTYCTYPISKILVCEPLCTVKWTWQLIPTQNQRLGVPYSMQVQWKTSALYCVSDYKPCRISLLEDSITHVNSMTHLNSTTKNGQVLIVIPNCAASLIHSKCAIQHCHTTSKPKRPIHDLNWGQPR